MPLDHRGNGNGSGNGNGARRLRRARKEERPVSNMPTGRP